MGSDDRYHQARQRFDELESEDRVRFLLEASVSTAARGLEEAGRVLADTVEDVLRHTGRSSGSGGSSERPGPAEPETAQRQAPPESGSSSTS